MVLKCCKLIQNIVFYLHSQSYDGTFEYGSNGQIRRCYDRSDLNSKLFNFWLTDK